MISNYKHIDVYHFIFTPEFASSSIARLFLKFFKKKSVQTISTPITRSKLRKCLFADKIVVLSEWTKERVLSLGYRNVIKINPGIDVEKFSRDKISKVRGRLNISKNDFVILFPVEYNADRGTRVVLKIIKELIMCFPNVKVIFACRVRGVKDLKEKQFLMGCVKNLGLEGNVIFLDRISFMPELINSSDIIIFPVISQFSKMEIPMVLLESLALEKPIIVSDVPPLNEILLKERGGFKIKPGDSEGLLKNIIFFVKNKRLKEKIGEEGRELIKREFDIKCVAKQYEKVYEELACKEKYYLKKQAPATLR